MRTLSLSGIFKEAVFVIILVSSLLVFMFCLVSFLSSNESKEVDSKPERISFIKSRLPFNAKNITECGNDWHTFEFNGKKYLYYRIQSDTIDAVSTALITKAE